MSKKIKQAVLNKIKKEKIKPLPKFVFVLRDTALILLALFFASLSVISMSLLLRIFTHGNILNKIYSFQFWHEFVQYYGLIYLASIVLTISGVRILVWMYKTGHRISAAKIIATVLLVNMILSVILLNNPQKFNILDKYLSTFGIKTFDEIKAEIWNKPDKGLLLASVLEDEYSDTVVAVDPKAQIWNVNIENLPDTDKKLIFIADRVLFIGYKESNNNFVACFAKIMPHFKNSYNVQNKIKSTLGPQYKNQYFYEFLNNERKLENLRNNKCTKEYVH